MSKAIVQREKLSLWKPVVIYLAAFPAVFACEPLIGARWLRAAALCASGVAPLVYWEIALRRQGSSVCRLLMGRAKAGTGSGHLLLQASLVAAFCFGARLLWWASLSWWGKLDDPEPTIGLDFYVSAVAASTVGPLVEEIFFRGTLLPRLARAMGWGWATLVSSACFGLFHADPVGNVCFAACLAALYMLSGSLWAPVVAHSAHNLLGTLFGGTQLFVYVTERPALVVGVSVPCGVWVGFFLYRAFRSPRGGARGTVPATEAPG